MLTFSTTGIPSYDFSSSVGGLIERAAHVELELELRQEKSKAIALGRNKGVRNHFLNGR